MNTPLGVQVVIVALLGFSLIRAARKLPKKVGIVFWISFLLLTLIVLFTSYYYTDVYARWLGLI